MWCLHKETTFAHLPRASFAPLIMLSRMHVLGRTGWKKACPGADGNSWVKSWVQRLYSACCAGDAGEAFTPRPSSSARIILHIQCPPFMFSEAAGIRRGPGCGPLKKGLQNSFFWNRLASCPRVWWPLVLQEGVVYVTAMQVMGAAILGFTDVGLFVLLMVSVRMSSLYV